MQFKLTQKERIKSKKQLNRLFGEGDSFFVYPFKVLYLFETDCDKEQAKILITVSKKKFKKAVERNRIKRLTREAFRKNKLSVNDFLLKNHQCVLLGLIYTGETILPYQEIERKLILILQGLIKRGKTNKDLS